jgi:hypothetical protein
VCCVLVASLTAGLTEVDAATVESTTTAGRISARMSAMARDTVAELVRQRSTRVLAPAGATGSDQTELDSMPFRPTPDCPRCNAGPALAFALDWYVSGSASSRLAALQSFDALLANQRQVSGALAKASSADIETMFIADHLGVAVLLLADGLDAAHRVAYTSAVTGAADFLVKNGNLRWYTNGNVVVGNALVMALAARLSGLAKYEDYYRQAVAFAVAPDQARWPGFGFVTTRAPLSADGSDGAGYFTETGSQGPGYDPDYTMLQSDQLSRLYLLTRDPAVLRLLNMVTNRLLERVDRTTWRLDASGGTRRNPWEPERFDTSALGVLAALGGRTDLGDLEAQAAVVDDEFRQAVRPSPPLGSRNYYALGTIPTSLVLAAGTSVVPPPVIPAPAPVPASTSAPARAPIPLLAAPQLSLAAPTTVAYGSRPRLTSLLKRTVTGTPVAGAVVQLWARPGTRRSYARIAVGRADSAGQTRWTLAAATGPVTYQVRLPAQVGLTPVVISTTARAVAVRPRVVASLSSSKVSRTVRLPRRSRATVRVSVPAGAVSWVQLERRTAGRWHVVSRARTDARGHARFRYTPRVKGATTLRVTSVSRSGLLSAASPRLSLLVR